jgi:hypothetical protein
LQIEKNIGRRGFLELLVRGSAAVALAGIGGSLAAQDKSFDDKYFQKIANPNETAEGDIFAAEKQMQLTKSCLKRFDRFFRKYGYGNFAIMNFDEVFEKASASSSFNSAEKRFMEELFSRDAAEYGFLGKKPMTNFTQSVSEKEIAEEKQNGQFLYKTAAEIFFQKMMTEVEKYNANAQNKIDVILTSGLRGIPKQMHLFLNKLDEVKGNLSAASRSLAPPGYSWHGAGDFDIGKKGFGGNFEPEFETTEEFKVLTNLGYLTIRYDRKNCEGVRYEPWHVKVAQEPHIGMETYKGIERLV